ncbi:MAG: class I SAM-dependent methyltransferase [Nocardioidaceae bacterium]|nr:MAG: class I SAM-dependent methyltransferase [Nocardioidaceae bacterium]
MLYDHASALPAGSTVLEIGSHRGRSSIVLAKALEQSQGRLICVDPFVDGSLFGGSKTREEFEANIAAAAVEDRIELVADYSTRLRPSWTRDIDLLYIDGKHDYWTFTDDLGWAEHLPDGGAILVHDAFSSIGVTLGVLAKILSSSRLRYVERSDSMALFVKATPTRTDRLRIVGELPWWIRNVGIKVLLRLRLRPLARLFGHDSVYDPY